MTPPADRRFVIYRGTQPLACYEDLTAVLAWLWGRDLRAGYLVLDYERPVPVDEPDLTAWAARHFPAAGAALALEEVLDAGEEEA